MISLFWSVFVGFVCLLVGFFLEAWMRHGKISDLESEIWWLKMKNGHLKTQLEFLHENQKAKKKAETKQKSGI